MNIEGWLSQDTYDLVCHSVPLVCVDLCILRERRDVWETLLIKRNKEPGIGKWGMIGGRVRRNELIRSAIARHASDLGLTVEPIRPFEDRFPAWVDDLPLQDPRFHAIALNFPVRLVYGEIREVGEEYTATNWFPVRELPDDMVSDHRWDILMVTEQIRRFRKIDCSI